MVVKTIRTVCRENLDVCVAAYFNKGFLTKCHNIIIMQNPSHKVWSRWIPNRMDATALWQLTLLLRMILPVNMCRHGHRCSKDSETLKHPCAPNSSVFSAAQTGFRLVYGVYRPVFAAVNDSVCSFMQNVNVAAGAAGTEMWSSSFPMTCYNTILIFFFLSQSSWPPADVSYMLSCFSTPQTLDRESVMSIVSQAEQLFKTCRPAAPEHQNERQVIIIFIILMISALHPLSKHQPFDRKNIHMTLILYKLSLTYFSILHISLPLAF